MLIPLARIIWRSIRTSTPLETGLNLHDTIQLKGAWARPDDPSVSPASVRGRNFSVVLNWHF